MSQEDLRDNAELKSRATSNLHSRFESASNTQEIPADEYRKIMRELNKKQHAMVIFR